ncbi:unnamed protein product [Prorocentrum cordatum]|uniref:H(+)-exporting diphosphatase n=1 Tax=Prorocentrum cordatum TaxID=2364126 RepID=A0ABN9T2D6_9DINO|nr:unnamed protein product [Polarella glacialis]
MRHMQRREQESFRHLGGVAVVGALAGGVTLGIVGAPIVGALAGAVGLGYGAAFKDAASGGALADVAAKGREARGAPAADGYRFGDLTRGFVACGKEARGAGAGDACALGDFTRGLSARLGGRARSAVAEPARGAAA